MSNEQSPGTCIHQGAIHEIATLLGKGTKHRGYQFALAESCVIEVKSLLQELGILRARVAWLQKKAGIKDGRP